MLDYESMQDLVGKQLKINFEILEGEGLPNKLCTNTFCEYEFYYTKDMNKKKNEMSEVNEDEEETMSDDGDEMDAMMGGTQASYAPKRKRKMFKTKTIDTKTSNPHWGYRCDHLITIDEEIILKLQSDSITSSVFGMQEGMAATGLNKNVNRSLNASLMGTDDPNMSELEKLRIENQKLMKMLQEQNGGVIVKKDGMCTTCNLF